MAIDKSDLKVPAMKLSELIELLQKAKTIYGDQLLTTLIDTGDDTQFHSRVTDIKIETLKEFFGDEDEMEDRIKYQFHEALIITGFDTSSHNENNDSIEI